MIPILFDANKTSFTTQGLGRLSGALECIVTEERNGAYELEMTYPVDGPHWTDIQHSRIIYARPADGKDPQPFRIYKIGKPLNGKCIVQARHISYQLSHIPVMPFTAEGFAAALDGLVTNTAEYCPFTVWTDKSVAGAFKVPVPTSFRALLGGTEGSLLDTFGTAEYEFDKYVVKAHVNRGVDRGVVLRYGKNITDLRQEENIQNTITGICPYWTDRETGACKTLPEMVLWSERAGNFPYKRTIPVDFSDDFEEQPTDEQLRAAGNSYIERNNIGVPEVSISLSFIPLWQTEEYKAIANLERVNLCDTVTVVFNKLGISATAKVVKTVYDVLKERYRSIEIGDAKTTLAKAIVGQAGQTDQKIKASRSTLEDYINYITEKITGGRGGYVTFNYNADGLPEEMLVMDKPSEATATKIIRINQNGIAFSTDGGATYRTGWTIDGVFNADFIGAGSLLATYIKLFGRMSVYTDSTLQTLGGTLGYMSGNHVFIDGTSETTNGMALVSQDGTHYIIVTNAGVRMTEDYNGKVYRAYLADGQFRMNAMLRAFMGGQIQGNVYLNATLTADGMNYAYSGTTNVNDLHVNSGLRLYNSPGIVASIEWYGEDQGARLRLMAPDGTYVVFDASYGTYIRISNGGHDLKWKKTDDIDLSALKETTPKLVMVNNSPELHFTEKTSTWSGLSEYNMLYIEVAFRSGPSQDRNVIPVYLPDASGTVTVCLSVKQYSSNNRILEANRFCDIDRGAGTIHYWNGTYTTESGYLSWDDNYAVPLRIFGAKI